ncbi:kinase-like domain-containing protein [Rhizophagus irregularis DAOM 181602=DAOM 197198]|nr:kinase-like domain-containing protein [Rhizophagus irregularis DAOM 181602=DAOM 197198]
MDEIKLTKGGFGSTFKADWKDGYILCRDYKNNQWERNGETKVALKCLHNSQDITAEFLKEVESTILACEFGSGRNLRQHLNDDFNSLNWMYKLRILKNISFGLSDIHNSGLIHRDFHCGNILSDIADELQKLFTDIFANWKEDSVIDKQIDEANEINEKSSSSTVQSPSSSTSDLSYMTHPQAVYTSRLLDFKNLPKPKNADNNDNLLGIEDSESTIIDFTKLDFNSKD